MSTIGTFNKFLEMYQDYSQTSRIELFAKIVERYAMVQGSFKSFSIFSVDKISEDWDKLLQHFQAQDLTYLFIYLFISVFFFNLVYTYFKKTI